MHPEYQVNGTGWVRVNIGGTISIRPGSVGGEFGHTFWECFPDMQNGDTIEARLIVDTFGGDLATFPRIRVQNGRLESKAYVTKCCDAAPVEPGN